jgi:signal peptidase I
MPIFFREDVINGANNMISKPKKKKKSRKLSRKQIIIMAILAIAVIGSILRIFFFSPYRIDGNDMQPGLYAGDFLLASKLSYQSARPEVGDLVLFQHPFHLGRRLVRRVVATEGQSVEIIGKTVYINNRPIQDFPTVTHSDPQILSPDYSARDYMRRQLVPPNQVFVLGDNRDKSEDSRDFGCVPDELIEGKGLVVYFSWVPDPQAPKMKSPYIVPAVQLFFYNVFNFPSRVRWDRLFTG